MKGNTMLVSLVLGLSLMFGGMAVAEEEVVENKPLVGFDFGISGDIFIPFSGESMYEVLDGVSLKVIEAWNGILSANVVIAGLIADADTLYGASIGANIPLLVKKAGGNWIADAINPSLGLAVLGNLSKGTDSLTPALHLQLIKYDF